MFDGWLYFSATDGSGNHGTELWRTDGSTVERVSDINSGGDASPTDLTVFDGDLYFGRR